MGREPLPYGALLAAPPPPAPTSRLSGEDGECVRALGRWVLSEPQILTPSSLSGKNPETWPR